jgi:hypothetical protein
MGITQLAPAKVRTREGLLNDVLGSLAVIDQQERQPDQTSLMGHEQLSDRVGPSRPARLGSGLHRIHVAHDIHE